MKRIMLPIVIIVCITISIFVSERVDACSCVEMNVKAGYEGASVVFTGKVISRDAEGGNIFEVNKLWKGTLSDGYVYSGFNGMCGTEFEVGASYLVYTSTSQGKETTGLCSGNKLIEQASEDIKILNAMTEPAWSSKYLIISLLSSVVVVAFILWLFRKTLR